MMDIVNLPSLASVVLQYHIISYTCAACSGSLNGWENRVPLPTDASPADQAACGVVGMGIRHAASPMFLLL